MRLRERLVTGAGAFALMLVLTLVLTSAGCGHDLQFVADHRLHVDTPRPRHLVTVPVTIAWHSRKFTVLGPTGDHRRDRGYFAVFLDRAPMPADRDLRWFARNDRTCRATEGCPSTDYLSRRRVFTTTDPSITFEHLPLPASHKGVEDHTVTIVLLDGAGRRIGESAWHVDFRYRRKKS